MHHIVPGSTRTTLHSYTSVSTLLSPWKSCKKVSQLSPLSVPFRLLMMNQIFHPTRVCILTAEPLKSECGSVTVPATIANPQESKAAGNGALRRSLPIAQVTLHASKWEATWLEHIIN